MATKGKKTARSGRQNAGSQTARSQNGVTRVSASVSLAKRGIQSSEDYRNLLCALMTDVVQGSVSPEIANAATNAGRALVRMVELEYKMASGRPKTGRGLPMSRRLAVVA